MIAAMHIGIGRNIYIYIYIYFTFYFKLSSYAFNLFLMTKLSMHARVVDNLDMCMQSIRQLECYTANQPCTVPYPDLFSRNIQPHPLTHNSEQCCFSKMHITFYNFLYLLSWLEINIKKKKYCMHDRGIF